MLPEFPNQTILRSSAPRVGDVALKTSQGFGTLISGVAVQIEEGWESEYFENQEIFPLPSTSRRLCGVMQLRGETVPVFDPNLPADRNVVQKLRSGVLVVKLHGEFLGIVVEQQPAGVLLAGQATADLPSVCFREALLSGLMGQSTGSGASSAQSSKANKTTSLSVWWKLDLEQFFRSVTQN